MPSLAEQAATARAGKRVRGGTEVPTGEQGSEQYTPETGTETGSVQSRPTMTIRKEAPEEQPEGLAAMLAKRKKQKLEEEAAKGTP